MELPLIFSLFGLVVLTLVVPAIRGIARRGAVPRPLVVDDDEAVSR